MVDVVKSISGKIDKIIVKLQKHDAGKENRKKYPGIAKKCPETVIIQKVSVNYSIRKNGGVVGSTATLVQFPIKLAYAITAHKIQGQTILKPMKVAFETRLIFEEAQGYVMFSRVQEQNQVFIIEEFDPNKIYPSQKALAEVERMNESSLNNNPSSWCKKLENSIKICFMNCCGLKPHYEDIIVDPKLSKSDAIHLLEISLENDDNSEFPIDGYSKRLVKRGKGKGIGTYFKEQILEIEEIVVKEKFQMMKCKHDSVDVICIYRSNGGYSVEILMDLSKLINTENVTLIVGDFNLCYNVNRTNRLIQGLITMGFTQLIHEPSHVQGRLIDHAYFHDPSNKNIPIVILT